jgi:hypothetical protein
MNRFAELVLVLEDGSVSYLETSGGKLRNIARDKAQSLVRVSESENANDWLMIPLVDRCVTAGIALGTNQCYGFRNAPTLGGEYEVAKVELSDIAVYLARSRARTCVISDSTSPARQIPPSSIAWDITPTLGSFAEPPRTYNYISEALVVTSNLNAGRRLRGRPLLDTVTTYVRTAHAPVDKEVLP